MLGVYCGHTEGADPTAGMGPRQKKLWELQQKLRASRKANQDAMVAEKRRQARPEGAEEAGEKRKWYEEKKARREADLKRMNLDEKKVRSWLPHELASLQGTCVAMAWMLLVLGLSLHASSPTWNAP